MPRYLYVEEGLLLGNPETDPRGFLLTEQPDGSWRRARQRLPLHALGLPPLQDCLLDVLLGILKRMADERRREVKNSKRRV